MQEDPVPSSIETINDARPRTERKGTCPAGKTRRKNAMVGSVMLENGGG